MIATDKNYLDLFMYATGLNDAEANAWFVPGYRRASGWPFVPAHLDIYMSWGPRLRGTDISGLARGHNDNSGEAREARG